MLDGQRIVVVMGVARDVFHHFEEWRKLDVVVAGNAFGLENHEVVDGLQVGVELKRSEEHTSELQSRQYLVCRLLLEKKKNPPRLWSSSLYSLDTLKRTLH